MSAHHDGDEVEVLLRRLDADLPEPAYAHPGDAGADLVTALDVTLGPGERAVVPTGMAIALPAGYAAFVHPRSGLAARHGVTIVNAPGTIDAGFRGEIQVTLINTDLREPIVLRRGDRIAQLVVQQVARARFVAVDRLPGSLRGEGGLGSTGGFPAAPSGTSFPAAPTGTNGGTMGSDSKGSGRSACPDERTGHGPGRDEDQ